MVESGEGCDRSPELVSRGVGGQTRAVSWFYRSVLRPWLFRRDSESVHDAVMAGLAWLAGRPELCRLTAAWCAAPELRVEAMGLGFPNPVGLAAGMDKRAAALPVWESLGYGFCEVGGVTWHPQPGNPKPRMFRAVRDGALVNRMGFNNEGAEAMAEALRRWRSRGRWPGHPVGVNLGKSKVTPVAEAWRDYAMSFERLRSLADFFVVNVSSPNTPNLRQLQDRTALERILGELNAINDAGRGGGDRRPILVKVAPDLSWEALDEIADVAIALRVAGIVATNTTIARPDSADPGCRAAYGESGGLSGRPLRSRSTEVIRHLYRRMEGRVPIIGVGGVVDESDAWEKVVAGASLLQVYTGMVYEGPGIARRLVLGLRRRLAGRRWKDVVGCEA